MRGRQQTGRLIAALGVLIVATACADLTPAPEEFGGKSPSFLPNTLAPSELIEPLGPILILRAYSGPFTDHAERNRSAAPDIVIFDDGLVVANVALVSEPPKYMAHQLSDAAMADVSQILQAAELRPIAAGGIAGGTLCADCPTTIIRTDLDGETIELAASGLLTTVHPRYVARLPYSKGLIDTDRLLNRLLGAVRRGPAELFVGDLPEIPAAPLVSG